jgi:hypothetical protein
MDENKHLSFIQGSGHGGSHPPGNESLSYCRRSRSIPECV